jgi:hypothetical protein
VQFFCGCVLLSDFPCLLTGVESLHRVRLLSQHVQPDRRLVFHQVDLLDSDALESVFKVLNQNFNL